MTRSAGIEAMPRADAAQAAEPRLFPVALKLAGSRCIVVGGGVVALRKVHDLLGCGAVIHAIAPEWAAEFEDLEASGAVSRSTRHFEPGDLDGARLVVAATDDPEVQNLVAAEADLRGIPCNVVDVNHLCSFYVPAVLRRGALTIAIATDGKFPLLAVALRDRIASTLDERAGEALERLAEARARAFAAYPQDPAERVESLRRLLAPAAVDEVVEGRLHDFNARYEAWKTTLPVAP
jgi:precorrin-2 dehydrogenase/sirohydrochlorin ferrochelatase